ncbi:MAG: hypothetical protein ACTTJZ_00890 [Sphaerochaetaceae bacterium]
MEQPELFECKPDRHDFDQGGIDAALAGSCRRFYRRSEVASICRTTYSVVRQAVEKMQLDALFIGGEYRVPSVSIHDWIADMERIGDTQEAYDKWIDARTIPEAYSLSVLYHSGCIPRDKALSRISGRCCMPLAEKILSTDFSKYDSLAPVLEAEPIDWYGLERLDMPSEADVFHWSGILAVDPKTLARLGGWNRNAMVSWIEFRAFLVSKELINQPVLMAIMDEQAAEPFADSQPSLF